MGSLFSLGSPIVDIHMVKKNASGEEGGGGEEGEEGSEEGSEEGGEEESEDSEQDVPLARRKRKVGGIQTIYSSIIWSPRKARRSRSLAHKRIIVY